MSRTCTCGHPADDHAGRRGTGECLDDDCLCAAFALASGWLLPVHPCPACGVALVYDGAQPRVRHACAGGVAS